MEKEYVIEGKDRPIRFKLFGGDGCDGVLVIIHGMQEHSGRYVGFAHEMVKNNIAVVTSDLRGHGSNMDKAPGLDDGDIFLNIVEDQKRIIAWAKEKFKNVPVWVLGHSYGSFVTQRLIRDRVNADRFILSGSSYMKGAIVSAGGMVAGLSRVFKGRESDARLIESMSIRGYGKKFENGNWLSRDEKVWQDYCADELCGKVFPVAFYQSMFAQLPKNYSGLKNSVGYCPEILLIAGNNDPVGSFGKGVLKLKSVYKNAGYRVECKLYEGARHEVLNEINKDEVIADILQYLKK